MLQNFCSVLERWVFAFFLNTWFQKMMRPDQIRIDLYTDFFWRRIWNTLILAQCYLTQIILTLGNTCDHLAWTVNTRPNPLSEDGSFPWKTQVFTLNCHGKETRMSWNERENITLPLKTNEKVGPGLWEWRCLEISVGGLFHVENLRRTHLVVNHSVLNPCWP